MEESATDTGSISRQTSTESTIQEEFAGGYRELRRIAYRHLATNPIGNQLSATELVHDAYLKLVDRRCISWSSRTHFFALGSRIMRQVLVDRARRNLAGKRGAGAAVVTVKDEILSRSIDRHVLAVEEALNKLAEVNTQHARIVELRFFGGMTVAEVAAKLRVPRRRIETEWTMIRAWLRAELSDQG